MYIGGDGLPLKSKEWWLMGIAIQEGKCTAACMYGLRWVGGHAASDDHGTKVNVGGLTYVRQQLML